MKVEKDYEELLKLLNKYKVRYCIIGAYAIAFYAKPRYTKDMDILIEPDIENARKTVNALNEFGFESLGLKESDFDKENKIVQLGYEPIRIDLLTSIKGYTFKEIWEEKEEGTYGETKAFFIGINELVGTKKKTGRKQDKADVEVLQKIKQKIVIK